MRQFETKEEFQDAVNANSSNSQVRDIRRRLGGSGEVEIQNAQLGQLFDASKTLEKEDEDKALNKKKKEARIASSIAKERIRVAVALAKLNDNAINNAQNDLDLAKSRGELSDKDLAKEQTKIKILEAEKTNRNKNLDTISSMVNLTGELTTKTEGVKDLESFIATASKDGVISETERQAILVRTNKVLEENTTEKDSQLIALRNDLSLSGQALSIDKDRLRVAEKSL